MDFSNGNVSKIYTVASLTCKPEDVEHNKGLLLDIKRCVGCKLTDEVKSTTILKSRELPKILDIIRQLRCTIFCYVVLKEELDAYELGKDKPHYRPQKGDSKIFAGFSHALCVEYITRKFPEESFLAIIDNMKNLEMTATNRISKRINIDHNTTIKFVDSKDSGHVGLQIVDIIAGLVRKAFEEYSKDKGFGPNMCCYCKMKKSLCRMKPHTQATEPMKRLFAIWPKFHSTSGQGKIVFAEGIMLYPPHRNSVPYQNLFLFMNCLWNRKKT